MRTTTILLVASLALVGVPLAAADESAPDCEGNQPWIGYRSTAPIRDLFYDSGGPSGFNVCEGEHWDGQDTVQSDQQPSCAPAVNANPSDFFVGHCLSADPNGPTQGCPDCGASQSAGAPLGLRVSSADGAVYVGANIGFVGRAVVYVSDDSSAVYVRDNTIGNALATVVSAARVTQGYVSEGDCTQTTYQEGAMTGTALCGRDNTAITVEYDLLA